MKVIQRRFSALVLLLFVFGLLAGCGAKAPAPAPADAPKPAADAKPAPATVKVGNVTSLLFAPFYVALEKGYFTEQGITVQLETVQAGQDAMVFLANGQLDFVLAGYSAALFNAASRGLDLKVIAPMGIQPKQGDPSPLVAAKGSGIAATKDLKGKKVAVAGGAGSTGSYLLARRLEKAGLTLGDVELVNLGLADQEAALVNKAIDAAIMSEPFATKALKGGAGDPVDQGALAGVNASGLLTSGTLLKEKSDVANRFVLALMKAARDIQGEQFKSDEHIKIFEKYTKLKPEVLKESVPYEFDANLGIEFVKKDLTALQEIMIKANILKLQAPVDVAKVTDGAPSAAALQKLGSK